MKIDLSIIIPCFNEEKNIPCVVQRYLDIQPKQIKMELILVDNGSTDKSKDIIQKYVKKHKDIKLIKVEKNIGYGYGIWSGLKNAKGEFICWTHADMQTDLNDTLEAYYLITRKKVSQKYYVKGSRKKRPLFDTLFALGMSIFETVTLKKKLYDINAQPNLFHKTFLNEMKHPPKDFSFDLYAYYLAKKRNYQVLRFPVFFPERKFGESKWNTGLKMKYKFIKRTMNYTFKLKRKLKNDNCST